MIRCFCLDDDPDRIRKFAEWFNHPSITWDCIQTAGRDYEFKPPYDYIFLDHDLGGSQMGYKHGRKLDVAEAEDNGVTLIRLIKKRLTPSDNIIIHSYNSVGAENMMKELMSYGITSHHFPFGGKDFMRNIVRIQEIAKVGG